VGAFIRTHTPIEAEDIITWCKGQVAPYKVPRHIHFVAEFPYNSSGKILKAELAKRLR
jgi:acyl-CoA synthetase (AMP-forming)/AMP-acid ligase II